MARYSCLIWRGVALFSFKVFVSTSRFGGVISTPLLHRRGKLTEKWIKQVKADPELQKLYDPETGKRKDV